MCSHLTLSLIRLRGTLTSFICEGGVNLGWIASKLTCMVITRRHHTTDNAASKMRPVRAVLKHLRVPVKKQDNQCATATDEWRESPIIDERYPIKNV